MNSSKIIFHIDMNCFFASCEIAQNQELIGKPVAVAHLDPLHRGIILSPNYEARNYGIKTTMITRDALLLCNELVIVEPDMQLYNEYSKLFFDYLYSITPLVEVASIDEGYLDVTEQSTKIHPLELAANIQKKLLDEYKLPCSIGIAPNKFLAKMGSDMKKPLGITVLRKREIDKYLWPLPISKMIGVGKKTTHKLQAIGINTIGDLANYQNISLLKETIGEVNALSLIEKANGIDNSIVDVNSYSETSSVSNSHTFDSDVYDPDFIKKTLKVLSNSVSHRLKTSEQKAQTIGIIIKYHNFKQINRSKGLDIPINNDYEIYEKVEELFDEHFNQGDKIRLVGVFANRLVEEKEEVKQYSIFDDLSILDKEDNIHRLLSNLKKQFGQDSIKQGYYEYKKKDDTNGD